MAGSSRKDFECITTGYPLRDYQVFLMCICRWECMKKKTTKWHLSPAKTQISLGIHPVRSESSLSAWRKLGSLATHWVHSEDWSDWADAQADLSLCRVHTGMPFCFLSCAGSYIFPILLQTLADHARQATGHFLTSHFYTPPLFYTLPHNMAGYYGFPLDVRVSVRPGDHPRFRGYFWANLDIFMKYFEVYFI